MIWLVGTREDSRVAFSCPETTERIVKPFSDLGEHQERSIFGREDDTFNFGHVASEAIRCYPSANV